MSDNITDCRNCGSANKVNSRTAELTLCNQCGMPIDWDPPSLSPLPNMPPPWLLASCQSCGHNFSRRVSTCPKCKTVRLAESPICEMQIPVNPGIPPKCDDPKPFLREDVQKISSAAKQSAAKQSAAKQSAAKQSVAKPTFGSWTLNLLLWIGGAACLVWLLSLMLGYF